MRSGRRDNAQASVYLGHFDWRLVVERLVKRLQSWPRPSARQPNPGSGSSYRRGKSVQTKTNICAT